MRGNNKGRKNRFDNERQRLATLNHPAISSIIDGGVSENGHPYMVMDYIDGQSIFDYVTGKSISQENILRLFSKACTAVSHAHNNLILHRDLKSENILVTADQDVKLIDFGIAAMLENENEVSSGPFSLVTAAPEQLKGETLSVQTDIFALSTVLHHLLSGDFPARQADGSVHARTRDLPKDLQSILNKGLQTEPGKRYDNVAELKSDIEAFQNSLPVSARKGNRIYKFGKLLKRAPIASALAASFILTLSGGLLISQHYARTAQIEAKRANQELARAKWNAEKAETLGSVANSYVDAFQYAFGQEADMDRLSDRLKDYHAIILKEKKEKNASVAATKSYAIGKHFLQRNDYVNARKVLEPWVNEGYGGDAQLLAFGQASLGHAYRNLGEIELASAMFEKSASFYVGTPEENTIEHAATAISAALLSHDPIQTKKARKIADNILENDERVDVQMYLWAQINHMESKQGNWAAAYDAITESVEIIDSGAVGVGAGLDSPQLNLAEFDILLKGNIPAARSRINKVQDLSNARKGESKTQGFIYELESLMAWSEGDVTTALAFIEKAIELNEKYSGRSRFYIRSLTYQGIMHANGGNFDMAENSLKKIRQLPVEKQGSWPEILQVYLTAHQEGVGAAQDLYDSKKLNVQKLQRDFRQAYFLKKLEEEGLVI